MLPKCKPDLVVTAMPGELLVYDRQRRTAHCLNGLAGLIFEACREGAGRSEAVARVAGAAGVDEERAAALIEVGLARLGEAALVTGAPVGGLSRREFLDRWGKVAAALPVVASLAAPLPAQAASVCCVPGDGLVPGSCDEGPPADCSCRCSPDASLDCSDPDRVCVRVHFVTPGGNCSVEFGASTCGQPSELSDRFDPNCETARQKVVDSFCGGDDASCHGISFYLCCACAPT